jgi:hypothetical protein
MYLLRHSQVALLLVAFALVLLSSCERPVTQRYYYNVDSLLLEQITVLAKTQAVLRKHAEMNAIEHDSTYTPADSAGWAKELDIFTEIGIINKPINRGSYTVTDGHPDEFSNLTIREYSANKPLPLLYLKTYYLDHPSKLRKIEALYEQENVLLKSRRKLVLEFTDVYQKNILSAYSIKGSQKMLAGDSVHFVITASVLLK